MISYPISVEPTEPAPKGWKWRKLTDVARLESGHTPSRKRPEWWGGDVPWLALPDIRELDGKTAHETTEYTNELGLANSSARLLPEGTVALSRTASVGFVTVFGKPMATSQDFVNWVCGDELEPWFLAWALIASRDYLRSLSSGAIHKTIYVPTVQAFRLCMPPRVKQRRIVAELNSRRETVRSISRALNDQLHAFEHLHHAFSASLIPIDVERIPAEQGWRLIPLGEAVEIIMGQSPPGSKVNKEKTGLPLLNGPTEFDRDPNGHPAPVQWTADVTKVAKPGDLLLCVRGATTGRRNWADRDYCIGRGLAALRPRVDGLTRQLLGFTIDRIVHRILARSAGSIFPNISGAELAGISVAGRRQPRTGKFLRRLSCCWRAALPPANRYRTKHAIRMLSKRQ